MPTSPRAGRRWAYRHRKSWSSSSADGTLKPCTVTPCGLTPLITWRMVPSLPPASSAWSTTSSPPQEVVVQFFGGRDLEAVHGHTLRVDPAHHVADGPVLAPRSEEHTSELQSLR